LAAVGVVGRDADELALTEVEAFDLGSRARAWVAIASFVAFVADAAPVSLGDGGGKTKVRGVNGLATHLEWVVERNALEVVGGVGQAGTGLHAVRKTTLLEDARGSVGADGHVAAIESSERRVPDESGSWSALVGNTGGCSSADRAIAIAHAGDGLAVSAAGDGSEIVARDGAVQASALVAGDDVVLVVGVAHGVGGWVVEREGAWVGERARGAVGEATILAWLAVLSNVRAVNGGIDEGAGEMDQRAEKGLGREGLRAEALNRARGHLSAEVVDAIADAVELLEGRAFGARQVLNGIADVGDAGGLSTSGGFVQSSGQGVVDDDVTEDLGVLARVRIEDDYFLLADVKDTGGVREGREVAVVVFSLTVWHGVEKGMVVEPMSRARDDASKGDVDVTGVDEGSILDGDEARREDSNVIHFDGAIDSEVLVAYLDVRVDITIDAVGKLRSGGQANGLELVRSKRTR